jgi:hypothetical protein
MCRLGRSPASSREYLVRRFLLFMTQAPDSAHETTCQGVPLYCICAFHSIIYRECPRLLVICSCGFCAYQANRLLTEAYDTFMFDCDGVLWRGGKLLPHSAEVLALLRSVFRRRAPSRSEPRGGQSRLQSRYMFSCGALENVRSCELPSGATNLILLQAAREACLLRDEQQLQEPCTVPQQIRPVGDTGQVRGEPSAEAWLAVVQWLPMHASPVPIGPCFVAMKECAAAYAAVQPH